MSTETFGQVVRERRSQFGLTQAELARRVGCAAITIRKIEADDLRPSVQMAELVITALNIPEDKQAAIVHLARPETGVSSSSTPAPLPGEIGLDDLSGHAVKGFELGERIGEGACGVVYRARQMSVNRDVAVKIIYPRFSNQPNFIRRFETEAQFVAQLEHPHIVPLYDYWRERNAAYLIMRYVRGGSLADRLRDGPLEWNAFYRIARHICEALETAHRGGIVHQDIKPANVLLDEAGNGYLSDFGIAINLYETSLTQRGVFISSPVYISPEQIKAEPIEPQSDIYCLGLMLYEMLVGQQPFHGPTPAAYLHQHLHEPLPSLLEANPNLPPLLDEVVHRATAKEPCDRHPDVATLLNDLQAIHLGTDAALISDRPIEIKELIENPYMGLRPFTETDAAHFHGRTMLIQELLNQLSEPSDLHRFMAIVGPSGSGKSSVVKAGVLPALRRGGLPGSEKWFIVDMTPGSHPWEELELALLRVAVSPPDSLMGQLLADNRGVLRAVRRILPDDGETELLLVVDQFEELFTMTQDETVRQAFMDSLVTAVLDPKSRLRVIITIRADFLDKPLEFVDFGELIRQRSEIVLPLSPDELEQAIVQPVVPFGMTVEPELLATLIFDVSGQPGTLPLLQYTLTELFERRDGGTLTLAAYQAIGGVTGALARRADEIYDSLDSAGQAATCQLFLRLITLSEGIEDTRRRVRLSEVEAVQTSDVFKTSDVLGSYGRARLLTFDHDPASREPTVEVAHEALLREWGRLRSWLEQSRDDLHLQRLLAAAMSEWQIAGQNDDYLLRGARLSQFDNWVETSQVTLTTHERQYLAASITAHKMQQADEQNRLQRELDTTKKLADTERQRAKEQTEYAHNLRRLVVYLGIALVVAAVFTIVALVANRQSNLNSIAAEANFELASTREVEAISEANERATAQAQAEIERSRADEQRDNALIAEATSEALAISEANQRANAEAEAIIRVTAEAVAVNERQEALRQASIGFASQALTELENKFPERAVPLALEVLENYPYTWQAERALGQAVLENRIELILSGHAGPITESAWSPDSTKIATASWDATAIVWDGQTGEKLFTLPGHTDAIYRLVWSPSGDRLVTTSLDGTARIWDAITGAELFVLPHEAYVYDAAWSPDGDQLITAAEDGVARIWDAATGEQRLTLLEGSEVALATVAWSPDGRQVATGDYVGQIVLWDAVTGDSLFPLEGHEDLVNHIFWSPSADRILSTSNDFTARTWDATNGDALQTFVGHTGWIADAIWSPEGDRIATASDDASVRMWNADNGETLFVFDPGDLLGDPWYPNYLAWSPDGNFLATNRFDGAITILNSTTGSIVYDLTGHTASINSLDWSADGDHLITGSNDGTARVWDVSPRAQILRGHTSILNSSGWSPDGTHFATNSFDGTARIWDTNTWQELLVIPADENALWMLRWDSTGERISTHNFEGQMKVWDAESGELLQEMELAPGYGGMDWSPTDSRLVAGGSDGIARMWNADSGELLVTFEGHDGEQINSVDWSPDGQLVVTSDNLDRAIVWNANSGEEVMRLQVEEGLGLMTQAVWSPDGKLIATHSDDPVGGRIWDVATGEVLYTFTGHSSSVWSLEWSLTGDRLLTAGGDGTARIWDAHSGAELLVYSFADWPAAHWSPDNQQIAFPLGDGTAWVVDVQWQNVDELIAYARECCLVRELTSEERLQFGLDSEE